VLEAADALSFAVSRAASSLATGKLDRVAVLVSGSLGSWFNGCLLDVIYQTLHDRRQEMLIYRTLGPEQRDEFFATLPARRNADALIVASLGLTSGQRQRLQRLDLPVVFVNQRASGAASVSIDDAAGATVATQHLINLGHRRIGYVGSASVPGARPSSAKRQSGFRAALAAAAVPKRSQTVISVQGGESAGQVVAQLLSRPDPPTALLVESDDLAMRMLAELWRVGVRTPEDLSVIGFDDHAMAATFGLTTIAQPVDQLGSQAATLALALAAGETPSRRVIPVPTRLVLRATTGGPR
jgi:DNA-binding LacI/PurR family transcriptional regulator